MSSEETEWVVAQRVANAIEAIVIYKVKIHMAHDSMNQVVREEATLGKNVSNKRKWGSDHGRGILTNNKARGLKYLEHTLLGQATRRQNMPTSRQCLSDTTIARLITQCVAEAMAAYKANQDNRNEDGNPHVNAGGVVPVARVCAYQDIVKCQPLNFKGTKGVFGLTRWFKKMEDSALTWWNSHKRIIRTDAAYAMTWKALMKLMTEVCCSRNEIQKMETELWNLDVKDDELTEKELKQIESDDQAIQTILLGLPEDIYAAVDSCETAQEIWLRVQQMMKGSDIGIQEKKASCPMNGKGSDIGIQEKKAKLFNEWERFTSNEGESIESYYHRFLKFMNDLKRNKYFPEKIASNLKFLNNLQPEWSRHVTIVHQTKDLNTADYTQLYDFLKYNQNEVDELKAERIAKTQDPLELMANSNNPYAFPAPHQDQSSFNQNYLQQPMPNPEDITDPTTAMNMALALMAKAFKLNYSTPTNNNQRISSNPRNRQIAQPGMNMGQDRQMQMIGGNGGNQFRQYAAQNAGNPAGYNDVIGNHNQIRNGNLVTARAEGNAAGQNGNQIRCYNCRGVGHYARNCTVKPRRRDAAYLQTQLLIAQKEEAGIQLQAEEYDLMAAAVDLDEIEEVNANCILMANLQQASTSGTQTDSAPVYDTDGSVEVHENCDDNEIFNMFTQEEQHTELLEPILESHQVPQHDNDVIFEDTSVKQGGETVEQHPANFEETHALYESLYQNLAIEVEKVVKKNMTNLKGVTNSPFIKNNVSLKR
nr:hypothetical protein [Tanacetum cinerariifolium]